MSTIQDVINSLIKEQSEDATHQLHEILAEKMKTRLIENASEDFDKELMGRLTNEDLRPTHIAIFGEWM